MVAFQIYYEIGQNTAIFFFQIIEEWMYHHGLLLIINQKLLKKQVLVFLKNASVTVWKNTY